jgi:predicted ester cyclase
MLSGAQIEVEEKEINKAVVRRWLTEFWGQKKLAVADEILTPDSQVHDAHAPDIPPGPNGYKGYAKQFMDAFSDMTVSIEDLLAEGDKVVARWKTEGRHTGALGPLPATGRTVSFTGTDVYRLRNGNLAEAWTNFDRLGLMQQLGAIPAEAAASRG